MLSLPLVACVTGVGVGVVIIKRFQLPSKLDAIPTVGSTGWLGSTSWLASRRFLTNAFEDIKEGCEKYKRAPFKIATFGHWTVILSNSQHLEELSKAPDDAMSIAGSLNDLFQLDYTMGPGICRNPCHVPIIRSQLIRNIGALYSEIRDEIIVGFDDVLDLRGNEWKSVPAFHSASKIACRASNRIYVGLPLCRNPDWVDFNIQYIISIPKGASIIKLFPTFLKSLAARLFTNVIQSNACGRKLLGPIIEERQRYLNEYGKEWIDKPNDFLSWLMDETEGPEQTIETLTARILVVNFMSTFTSSIVLTHVMFYLAANPQYIQPLREEVEAIVHNEGWSKDALDKMHKLDSFLKECQRVEGISAVSLGRKALKDFTFSDGTFVPKGTNIAAASRFVHLDEEFYPNAHAWEPFRFAEPRKEDGEGMKYRSVSTTTEYLPFGLGRHACSGRFFAITMLKSILAHIVTTYDVKLEDDTAQPQALHVGLMNMAHPTAKVMFRRRTDLQNEGVLSP